MEILDSINPNSLISEAILPSEKEKFISFIFLLIGQMASLFGISIVMFVIVWWITVETESDGMVSLAYFIFVINTINFIPILILNVLRAIF